MSNSLDLKNVTRMTEIGDIFRSAQVNSRSVSSASKVNTIKAEITALHATIQYSRHYRGGIIMALPAHDIEIRPNHLWAGDAGQIAAGKAGEVFMVKTGQKEPEDLSDNEAVRWV
jgi:hypothetical protein